MSLLDIMIMLSWFFLYFLVFKSLVFFIFSYKHYRTARFPKDPNYRPFVSVIVPCYNEGPTLSNCLFSMTNQSYTNFEILVVDDGSTDNTREVASGWVRRYPKKIRLLAKANGGKGSALNYGIENAKGEIIVSLDADSVFLKDTLENLIAPFSDSSIVAVGGNVKVSNRQKLLNKHQAVEYISGLNINRRVFAYLNCMQVIAGAIGAFRKGKVLEVGGYSSDTLVEDMDLTVKLAERGYRIEYNSKAIAYTEAPDNLKNFIKQRYRWIYGGLQVLKKHRHILFRRKYGNMGMIGLPYFLIFPWIDVFISGLYIFTIIRLIVFGQMQPLVFLTIFALTTALQVGMLYYALQIDKEDKKFAVISVIESLWYHHLINLITIKVAFDYTRGVKATWNKLARLGQNVAPQPAILAKPSVQIVAPIAVSAADSRARPGQQIALTNPIAAIAAKPADTANRRAAQRPSSPPAPTMPLAEPVSAIATAAAGIASAGESSAGQQN